MNLIVDPTCSTLRHWTLMVAQCFAGREESSAIVAKELADFPMFRHLVPETIVLPGKSFRTSERTRKRNTGLRFVGFHMHLQCVLARETSRASRNLTRETPLAIGVTVHGRRLSGYIGFRGMNVPRRAGRGVSRGTLP